eukprot:5280481-Pyramimonas_sp.AAC.1
MCRWHINVSVVSIDGTRMPHPPLRSSPPDATRQAGPFLSTVPVRQSRVVARRLKNNKNRGGWTLNYA